MGFLRILGTRRARITFNVVGSVIGLGVAILTTRHFVQNGWPLGEANVLGVVGAGALFLAAYGFKAWGWQRLFRHDQRPGTLALAAAGGAATVTGLALPGRADEVVRITVVRKFPGKRAGIGSICLSLFLLGLPFLTFATRERGVVTAIKIVPLHFLHYLLAGISFAVAWLLHHIVGEPQRHATDEAFAELGIETWPPVPRRRAMSAWRPRTHD